RLAWVGAISAKEVQESLNPDEDLIEVLLGERRSFAWLISRNRRLPVEILPGRRDIEKAVERYIRVINARPNGQYSERQQDQIKNASEDVLKMVFGKLADELIPGRRLIIVPDGILHYLPFESLVHKGRYLVETQEISYLQSASMLRLPSLPPGASDEANKMDLLAFGDPVFGPERSVAAGASRTKRVRNRVQRAAEGMDSPAVFNLPALPRTRDEVENIASLFGPGRSRVFVGKDSTEDAFKAELIRR